MNNTKLYTFFRWMYAIFYIAAGANHFISSEAYLAIMPPYLPLPITLIYISGVAEIGLGVLSLFSPTQKIANLLIILMLIAFLPAHIYMIQSAPFMLGTVKVTLLIAWARIPLQFLLIFWAWFYIHKNQNRA
ncbi:DoxX family protein [Pedobacter sp. AW1-32]|uniref:DoxX family protein n=1 Tax=Pedobacter sp. AW1-32 TaxID=3383026 RepID=UPI003FF05EC3